MLVSILFPPLYTVQVSYPGNDPAHSLNGSFHINEHNQDNPLQTYLKPSLNLDSPLLLCPEVVLSPDKLTINTDHHSN